MHPPDPEHAEPAAAARRPWLALVAIGIAGGVLSGMFGVGGGIVMIPLLLAFGGMTQRTASATSLAAIVPAAIAGSTTYGIAGQIDLAAAALLAVGGILGSIVGSRLLRRLPLGVLSWMFVGLLVLVAVRMALVAPERGPSIELDALSISGLLALGIVIGVVSGLFGIGGGVVAVPALIAVFGFGELVAKGTSLAMMIPTALSGSASNVRAKLTDLPAAAVVGLAAVASSFAGVALAFLVPPRVSGIVFAILLLASATQLAIKAIRRRRAG